MWTWTTINNNYYNCTIVEGLKAPSDYVFTISHNISHQTITVFGLLNAFYTAKLLDLEYRVSNWYLSSERKIK